MLSGYLKKSSANFLSNTGHYRSLIIFILKVLVIYLSLYYLFLGYVGVVDARGEFFSPFLAKYSILNVILQGLIYPTKFILSLMGFEVFNSTDWLAIRGAKGVRIAFPCLGVEMMIAIFSLIVSYPAVKAKKVLFILGGFAGIHFINILRITGIILTNYYSHELTSPSHTIFNISVYGFIILYFYWWLQKFTGTIEIRKV